MFKRRLERSASEARESDVEDVDKAESPPPVTGSLDGQSQSPVSETGIETVEILVSACGFAPSAMYIVPRSASLGDLLTLATASLPLRFKNERFQLAVAKYGTCKRRDATLADLGICDNDVLYLIPAQKLMGGAVSGFSD